MIGQTIQLSVKAGMVDAFEALVSKLMRDVSKNEPEAIYDVRRIRGLERNYLYFISFPDQDAYDRYMSAPYHLKMSPKATAMLEGEPVFEDLDCF